jgi:hypothetical protein
LGDVFGPLSVEQANYSDPLLATEDGKKVVI